MSRGFVLLLVACAVAGGGLGRLSHIASATTRGHETTEPSKAREPLALPGQTTEAPHPGAPSSPATTRRPVAPKTLAAYFDLLARLRPRKGTSEVWSRWAWRLEAALAADPSMFAEFLLVLEAPGDRRSLCLDLLAGFSPGFLGRADLARVLRMISRDPRAQVTDRVAVIALPCWGPNDASAWDALADLARFDREETIRDAALSRLSSGFSEDPRTRRLLADGWWKESDPTVRATQLASTLAEMDAAGRADLIPRVLTEDASPEAQEIAATQVLQCVLAGDCPMSADARKGCSEAMLAALRPTQPESLRRVLIVSLLAVAESPDVDRLISYLERQENDADLRTWALDAARRARAIEAPRGGDFLRGLLQGLEDGR